MKTTVYDKYRNRGAEYRNRGAVRACVRAYVRGCVYMGGCVCIALITSQLVQSIISSALNF